MKARVWYRPFDAALWRATTSTADVVPRQWPALDGGYIEPLRTWIRQVWAREDVADAVAVASPVLAGRVEAVLGGSRMDDAQVRRITMSLARYLVRMRVDSGPKMWVERENPCCFST